MFFNLNTFSILRYTSSFLRQNVFNQNDRLKISQLLKDTSTTVSSSSTPTEKQSHPILDPSKIDSLDESMALGTCYWEDYAQEPVWNFFACECFFCPYSLQ